MSDRLLSGWQVISNIPGVRAAGAMALAGVLCLPGMAVAQTQTLNVALAADIRSTDPGVNRDDMTDAVVLHVVEGLVGYRENGTVAPLLAESVDVSKDGMTYTFKLRRDVHFHNGAALTSADVLWSWQRYTNPKTGWACLDEFDGRKGLKVTKVSAPDAYTVVMQLNRPASLFLDTLARTYCGMTAVINKASVKPDGTWDKPIGTGPFKLTEWKRGEYVLMSAFTGYKSPAGNRPDGYVGAKAPLVDTLKFAIVPDTASAKAGLQSGALSVARVAPSDVVELQADKRLKIIVGQLASKNALLIQTRDPVVGNQKLRQAIAASLDIPQIAEAISEGHGGPNSSAVPTTSSYYDATQKKGYTYDPALAKRLLKEAGYKGQKIVIFANKRVNVPSYTIAVIAQAMMQAVGINAVIEVLEWTTQLDRYYSGAYQISSFSYSSRIDPALSYEQFSGDKTKQPQKVWDDPRALALIDQSREEADPVKRQAMFDQLHTMMLDQVPLILLSNGMEPWAVGRKVEGFSAWEGKPRLWQTRLAK